MKKTIRKLMLDKRAQLNKEQTLAVGESVYNKLLTLNEFVNAKSCFCYVDFKNEVPTKKIMDYFKNKSLFVPVVDGEIMHAVEFADLGTKNNFGVCEPINYKIVQKCPDISVIPLVACDVLGNRIGFGKGYYDKYLANKQTVKIAVCYDFQVIDSVPSQPQDIKMDYIITEKRIIKV